MLISEPDQHFSEKSNDVTELGNIRIRKVSREWTRGILLAEKGIFLLHDVAPILEFRTAKVKAAAFKAEASGQSSMDTLGVRRFMEQWIVDLDVFSSYYLQHLYSEVKRVETEWDGNDLLSKKGTFYLNDVCTKIPFTAQQLRHQASKSEDPKKEMGIWKDEKLNTHLVDMKIFGSWVRETWLRVTGRNSEWIKDPARLDPLLYSRTGKGEKQ